MQPPPAPPPPFVPPQCVALILASSVAQDPDMQRWSVIRIYDQMEAADFPATYPSMEVYAALTGGHGDSLIELQLIDADETRPPIFRQLLLVQFEAPL